MKIKKLNTIKQKIAIIPIIIVTVLSFIIPNYAHAGWFSDTSDNMFKSLIDLLLYIPDSIMLGIQNSLTDDKVTYSDMITKISAADQLTDDLIKNYDWLGPFENIGNVPWLGQKIAEMTGHQDQVKVDMSNIKLNLMTIFSNKVEAFNVNFFKNTKNPSKKNIAANLRNIIATWYVTLRNIALVLMLLVLVFIGIKITVSSVAGDKAKYKQLLVDWLVGICLLVFMHYIMVFSVNLNEAFVNMFSIGTSADELLNLSRTNASAQIDTTPEDGDDQEGNSAVDNFYWAIIYTVLVFYILAFSWQYLKRVVKLAFLTLFAPIMALSYPLDKISDGKAQGFDRWLKDYIFTLLIQPIHLLLYLILISSVSTLVENNPLYALVALGSLMPVEKMLREYLGFDRGHIKGPNPMGPLAAASVIGGAAKKLLPSNIKEKDSKRGSNDREEKQEKPIDTSRGDNAFGLLASGGNPEQDRNRTDENNNSRREEDNEELDETGRQWQDYIDTQEDDNGGGLPGEESQNGQKAQDEYDRLKAIQNDEEKFKISDNQEDYDRLKAIQNDEEIDDNAPRYTDEEKDRAAKSLKNEFKNMEYSKNTGRGDRIGNIKDKFGMTGNRFKAVGSRMGKVGRGLGAVAKLHKPTAVKGLKKAAKIAGAVTLGSAGLLMGTAAGIASGDISKVVEYGAAGAASAGAIGAKGTEGVMNLAGGLRDKAKKPSKTADAFRRGYNPEEFQKTLQKRQAKEDYKDILNNNNAMLSLRAKAQKYNMSDKQLKETIRNYSDQGITNYKDISKGMELQQEAGVSEKQAMGAIKLSKTYDASSIRKDEAKLNREIQSNLQGRDANPEQTAQKSIDLLKMVHGMTPTRRL